MLSLDSPIDAVPGVGSRFAKAFHAAGIHTASDLLFYFPYRYMDFSAPTPINRLLVGEGAVIAATVEYVTSEKTPRRRMVITKALLKDESGTIEAIWFNQPFITNVLKEGNRYYFYGKMVRDHRGRLFQSEQIEREERIYPVYHQFAGFTSRWLRVFVGKVLPFVADISETFPLDIMRSHDLLTLGQAITECHMPGSSKLLTQARRRLGIDELLPPIIHGIGIRQALSRQSAVRLVIDEQLLKDFTSQLAFSLTDDQRKAAWQIIQDLAKSSPMNRLLQGEVGSGKTVVAAMAALMTARSGYQTVWFAPTEILARQHYHTVSKLLAAFDVSVGLWTSGTKEKIDAGLVIGTHALLNRGLHFPKLALMIIDEQHRFGVKQRAQLKEKSDGTVPHFLSMTTTPIPRTLALTVWGDLDLTIIKELPRERLPIETRIVDPAKRGGAYQFVRSQVAQGRQVFVITPIIQKTEDKNITPRLFADFERKSAIKEFEKLSKEIFPDLRIGLLHGKMNSAQKHEVMEQFASQKLDILVSTAVVEVGIDVPNATVMMIEGADRFGLAQLHQLRGRVGRGAHQSYCLLLPERQDSLEHKRLAVMAQTNSGLELAEYDLKFRGPGEVFGSRQHGLPQFKIASLGDPDLVEEAQQIAREVLAYGLNQLPALKKNIEEFETVAHLE